MNVYVVIEQAYHDNGAIRGIYTTLAKAQRRLMDLKTEADKRGWTFTDFWLKALIVDLDQDLTV